MAALLGRDAEDLPCIIRKTGETPPKYSVVDVVVLVKKCTAQDAAKDFRRLQQRYGDWWANCPPFNLPDSQGRVHPNRPTPVTTIEGIVEIVLLLTGRESYCCIELLC